MSKIVFTLNLDLFIETDTTNFCKMRIIPDNTEWIYSSDRTKDNRLISDGLYDYIMTNIDKKIKDLFLNLDINNG